MPQTRLNVSIDNSRLIVQKVAASKIDMGLIEAPCHMLELLAEPWLDDKLLVVAAPGHPLASQGRLHHQKLRQAEWIFRETSSDTHEEADYALLQHLRDDRNSQLESDQALRGGRAWHHLSVAAGDGRFAGSGQLSKLTTVLPPLSRRFYLLRHTDKFVSPAQKRFWLHCTEADAG